MRPREMPQGARAWGDLVAVLRPFLSVGREPTPDDALGTPGLGLDSLGTIAFVTAVERAFRVPLSDEIWAWRDRLTLGEVAHAVAVLVPGAAVTTPPPAPGTGGLHAARHLAARALATMVARVYRADAWHLLQFDLGTAPLPAPRVPEGVTLRCGGAQDAPLLAGLWPEGEAARKRRSFEQRLEAGSVCLLALQDDRAVAIDWWSATGDDERQTGLRIRMERGSCYGFDLHEHPELRGRGLGLALLAFSLAEARRRGFERQVTLVHAGNRPMLAAAIQLCGYRRVGSVRSRRVLGRPAATWTLGDQAGVAGAELRI